ACFGTPELAVGLFPHVILPLLQRHVPRKVLPELVYTGAQIEADRAAAVGLVTRVSAPGAALPEARELAETIASRSPAIVSLGKAAFHRVADMPLDDALESMNAQLTLNLLTDDAMEGIAAFL